MPHFSSPLVVYPKAKQKRYALVISLPFVALSLWRAFEAYRAETMIPLVTSLCLLAAVIWLVCAFVRGATRDITVVIPPTITIAAFKVIEKLFPMDEISILSLLEVAFWMGFTVFFIKGICGKCKIIVPMLFLFFGFFYAFIRYDLRAELSSLSTQVVLLLILWFILDAATFTSLPEEKR